MNRPFSKPVDKGEFEGDYILLMGSQGPYMLKTLRVQPAEIEKLGLENIGLPHLQHHSMRSESVSLALSPSIGTHDVPGKGAALVVSRMLLM